MQKIITLIAIGWSLATSSTMAQLTIERSRLDAVRPFVFTLKVSNKRSTGDGLLAELTAFKLDKHPGLYTALHGLTRPNVRLDDLEFTAVTYAADESGRQTSKTFNSFTVSGFDAARDIAYLETTDKAFVQLGGLELASSWVIRESMPVYVVGFPGVPALKGRPRNLDDPGLQYLQYMLLPGSNESQLSATRKSPILSQRVFQLRSDAIFSGDSGCPVFNMEGKVIGLADGGVFNPMNDKISAWAIPLDSLEKRKMLRDEEEFNRIAKLSPPTFLMAKGNFKRGKSDTPWLTVGVTLSRPFWLTNDDVPVGRLREYTNGRFDAYVEWTPRTSRFSAGFYVSSRYLQYRILRPFEYNLPLEAERIVRQDEKPDSYGLQASWIFDRGARHNTYIGFGGSPAFKKNDDRVNYRGFLGYRLYARPRRKLGLEVRAMYVYQEFLDYRQTLGIARRQIQTLQQLYLCGGLTYSIYRRD